MKNYQYVCVMKGLNKSYPNKEVLKNVWLSFLPGAKIGVIGHNGSGKSTILKIIAGIDKEFTGEAWIAEGIKAGYLPQEPQLDSSKNDFENKWFTYDGLRLIGNWTEFSLKHGYKR